MNNLISPDQLMDALSDQLDEFLGETVESVNACSERAVERLVSITRQTAPKRSGKYRKAITAVSHTEPATGAKVYTWGAKAPHHRLTHLLVHGHEARDGGRVDGDPFLENALNEVLPDYQREVEEVLGDD